MEREHTTDTDWKRVALPGLALLVLWVFLHPYYGVWHDGLLYVVQALHNLHPDAYKNDLFFLYGSQDDYTLFTPLYSAVIAAVGLNAATVVLFALGQALWVLAAVALAHSLLGRRPFWFFLVLLATLPPYYGAYKIFSYGETFLTARLYAEALVLGGLALVVRQQHLFASLLFMGAMLVHPLMGVWGVIFMIFYYGRWDIFRFVIALFCVMAVLYIGHAYFSATMEIFAEMDDAWYQLVLNRSPFLFVDAWPLEAWNQVALDLSIIAGACFLSDGKLRRVLQSLLWISAGGLISAWVGTSLYHNALIIQIQPWRLLWLVHWFGYLALAWLFYEYWYKSQITRVVMTWYVAAWLLLDNVGGMLALFTLAMLLAHHKYGASYRLTRLQHALLYLVPLQAFAWWMLGEMMAANIYFHMLWEQSHPYRWLTQLVREKGALIMAAATLWLLHWNDTGKIVVRSAALWGMVGLLGLSFAVWDTRGAHDYTRIDEQLPTVRLAEAIIPPSATVYWEDNVAAAWLLLGRSHYASMTQAAGNVFSRQTAVEAERRRMRLAALGVADAAPEFIDTRNYMGKRVQPSLAGLMHVCHDPVLDYVIHSEKLSNSGVTTLMLYKGRRHAYLYDCKKLRGELPDL